MGGVGRGRDRGIGWRRAKGGDNRGMEKDRGNEEAAGVGDEVQGRGLVDRTGNRQRNRGSDRGRDRGRIGTEGGEGGM